MRKGDSLFSSITFKIILEYLVFPFFSPPKVILILSSYPADFMFNKFTSIFNDKFDSFIADLMK